MNIPQLNQLPVVSLGTGQVLITEGETAHGLYFLESGEVEVVKGGTLIAEVYETGAVFGDMAYLLQTAPTATVRALTDCVFRHVADPASFFQLNPAIALHMAVVLARRVDSLNRYLVEIKHQFKDRADHLGMIDEVLDSLMHKHPRHLPRRDAGD